VRARDSALDLGFSSWTRGDSQEMELGYVVVWLGALAAANSIEVVTGTVVIFLGVVLTLLISAL
jgi:hypothetical protein